MSNNTIDRAMELEALLPSAMTVLFPTSDADPLRHLSVSQIRLLRALLSGPKSAGQLCAEVGVSPSSLTQIVGRLVAVDLVGKECGQQDRRVRTVHLTERGRTLMEERRALRAQAARKVLERMPANHPDDLIHLLQAIVLEHEAGGMHA